MGRRSALTASFACSRSGALLSEHGGRLTAAANRNLHRIPTFFLGVCVAAHLPGWGSPAGGFCTPQTPATLALRARASFFFQSPHEEKGKRARRVARSAPRPPPTQPNR